MSSQQKRVDEDEDLDELDDVLEQFSQSAQPTSPPQPSTSAGASTSTQPPAAAGADVLTEGFAAKLAEEMASLFKDLGVESSTDSKGTDETMERERLAAAWEAMLIEEMNAMSDPLGAGVPTDAPSPKPEANDFHSRIQSTMNKRKERESDLKSSDSPANGASELELLLSQLQDGLLPDGEAESEEQLQGMLEAMMGQLMSKDVLYEPLKELHEKFPSYLAEHDNALPPEDKKRFDAQRSCIKKLLNEFEVSTYRDEDEKAREKIVELMAELQTHGSPPEEIMGPLPPGFTMGANGLPDNPGSCTII